MALSVSESTAMTDSIGTFNFQIPTIHEINYIAAKTAETSAWNTWQTSRAYADFVTWIGKSSAVEQALEVLKTGISNAS